MNANAANRHEEANRRAKAEALARAILKIARAQRKPLMDVFPKGDAGWFFFWRLAECASAPSEQTKAETRAIVENWALVLDPSKEPRPIHRTDADCAPFLDADKQCAVCGVSHSGPACADCGQCGFHLGDAEGDFPCGYVVAVRS